MTDEQKPASPAPVPFVPASLPTPYISVAGVYFNVGNGAIVLQVGEMRESPVAAVGDRGIMALFELGRFGMTPRALRQLADSVAKAVKQYEESTGAQLPSEDAYVARAAMSGLISPMPPR